MKPQNGFFGIGVWHLKSDVNIGTLMRSAYCFGADFVFTVGRRYGRKASDTVDIVHNKPCFNYKDIHDLIDHLPQDTRLVGIELAEHAYSLDNYIHPNQCVYLLGAEDHGLSPEAISMCHEIIQIPGASQCLNVASAGSIVLYDRIAKKGHKR